jgi:hypothetical protein
MAAMGLIRTGEASLRNAPKPSVCFALGSDKFQQRELIRFESKLRGVSARHAPSRRLIGPNAITTGDHLFFWKFCLLTFGLTLGLKLPAFLLKDLAVFL